MQPIRRVKWSVGGYAIRLKPVLSLAGLKKLSVARRCRKRCKQAEKLGILVLKSYFKRILINSYNAEAAFSGIIKLICSAYAQVIRSIRRGCLYVKNTLEGEDKVVRCHRSGKI